MRLLGISGSVREKSFNRGLLRAAVDVAPNDVTLSIFDISEIPVYNADFDGENQPEVVRNFKRAISESDALLIATPEYNASFSGVLKNAIDWASRPLSSTPLMDKPAALMGASGGPSGTIRAQAALLQVLVSCGVRVMPKPGVVVRHAGSLCDDTGLLTDEETRNRIREQIEALGEFSSGLNGGSL